MWRVYILLRREGFTDNHTRVHRIYKEEGMNLSSKRPRRNKSAAHRVERPELKIYMSAGAWILSLISCLLVTGSGP